MNIGYISSIDISLPNGPGVNEREFLWTLQNAASRYDYRVSSLIPKPSANIDFALQNATFYMDSDRLLNKSYLRYIENFWKLATTLLKSKPLRDVDLYVLRLDTWNLLLPHILRLLGKPYYIKTLEDIYGFSKRARSARVRFNFLLKRILIRTTLCNAAHIDACTPQLVNLYRDKFNILHISMVDNAVNAERYRIMDKNACRIQCGLERFDKVVGYCGGFPSQRGARQLIWIAQRLLAADARCAILIVGDDADLSDLRRQAKQIDPSGRIRFTGVVPYESLPVYVNCLDVGIAFDTAEKLETVGNASQKIRQYLACGIPVICGENTNHTLVENGLCFPVSENDPYALYRAVRHFLDLPDEAIDRYRRKARKYAVEILSTHTAHKRRYELWRAIVMSNRALKK